MPHAPRPIRGRDQWWNSTYTTELHPLRLERPRTLADLERVVNEARALGLRVRAVGRATAAAMRPSPRTCWWTPGAPGPHRRLHGRTHAGPVRGGGGGRARARPQHRA
ncbi:MAG: hypothetical protein IPG35_15110 [Flavobacteriales bacterium]|nr:hypothetical protein [Flavobacteriales bacterium]